MYKTDKLYSLWLNAAKNIDFMKKALSKSCLELNSLQKIIGCVRLFPPGVGLGGLKDWHVRSIVMWGKEENRLTSRFNAAGTTDYMKKRFK